MTIKVKLEKSPSLIPGAAFKIDFTYTELKCKTWK